MEIKKDVTRIGVVTSRKCPTCGHHEVGLTSKDGSFYPLRPGTWIQILEDLPSQVPGSEAIKIPLEESNQEAEAESEIHPWIPEPVKGDRSLRLKYGVMVKGNIDGGQMNGDIFQAAYIEKLRNLIEREIHIPVPVILDRFFAAPHLASGNPEELALAMWQELEEIRQPVKLVKAWLENPDEERLEDLIQPKSKEDVSANLASDPELKNELEQLSLEAFLSLL